LPQLGTPTGRDGHKAPEQASAEYEIFAPVAVADEAGKNRAAGVHPHERRPDPSELLLVEMELALQYGEHRCDGLPVRVVEKAHEPEHEHDSPLVVGRMSSEGRHAM